MAGSTTRSGESGTQEAERPVDSAEVARLREENASLAATAERYRRLLEHADVGVWEIDADARTSFVNACMARMLGYAPDEMLGRGIFEHMDDEARADAERQIDRRRSGIREQHDFRFRSKEGRDVWTRMVTAPVLSPEGRYLGALAFVTDITAQRREAAARAELEERLVQTQKFESLGMLAGGIAHDFNNYLQSILGEASLALAELANEGRPAEAFRAIQRSAEQAARLTRQMLAFSGRTPSAVEPRDVAALVRDMEPLFRASLGRTGRLHVEVEPGLPKAEVDTSQLRQLMVNLVSNGADAMRPKPGVLRVSVAFDEIGQELADRLLPLGTAKAGPHLRLTVSDEGEGIRPSLLPRVFDPFVTTREHGRGLGLTAVLGIVQSHGGGVELRSGPQGTTISVYLPSEPMVRESDVGLAAPSVARRVLVVDDEPMIQRIVQLSLERAGYQVVLAGSAEEALGLLDGPAADVGMVLLDVSLPGMDGEQAFAKIRERTPAHVMFCSGYAPSETVRTVIEAGNAASFMQKPYRPTALIAAVDGVLKAS